MATPSAPDPSPVIVVLNPDAGRKQGREQFTQRVKPALERSGTAFYLLETTSQGHAHSFFQDFVRKSSTPRDVTTLRVMVLGGDGTVHEIVNGILRGLDTAPHVADDLRPRIEMVVFPTGTGNAIATSLGIFTVEDALERFISWNPIPLRVVKVSTCHQEGDGSTSFQSWKPHAYTVVVNSFGLHCATVHDSEGYRGVGNARFKISALKNVMWLKQYEARLDLYGTVQRYDRTLRELIPAVDGSTVAQNEPSMVLSGPFTYLMMSKQASLEPGFTPTPFARTSDDWLDILAVQNVGRGQILQILGAAATNGQHVDNEHVEYYKAKVVELETPTPGRMCIDGEFMDVEAGPQGRVRLEVLPEAHRPLFFVCS
ncbi:hypothetical protein BGZ72_010409 [Mortierella alpina]|nr:hypothetical protein BGZ72_010409 [Mortierella alpina]